MTNYDVWHDHPEYINELKVLHANGMSAAQVAMALNLKFSTDFTRNAIIGKTRRLDLPTPKRGEREPVNLPQPAKPKRPKLVDPFRTAKFTAAFDLAEKLAADEPVMLPADQSEFAVPFRKLNNDHCRWPIDQPSGPIWYCGAQKVEQSYCRRHARIAFRAVERRRA